MGSIKSISILLVLIILPFISVQSDTTDNAASTLSTTTSDTLVAATTYMDCTNKTITDTLSAKCVPFNAAKPSPCCNELKKLNGDVAANCVCRVIIDKFGSDLDAGANDVTVDRNNILKKCGVKATTSAVSSCIAPTTH